MHRALIAAAIALASPLARASPGQDLITARHDFITKNCQSVKQILSNLLYPSLQLAAVDDLVDAHAMLGACDVDTGERERAVTEFQELLQLQPTKTLDTLIYTSAAQRVFNETKADMEARDRRDAELHKQELETARIEAIRKSLALYASHPYYVNFVPFGAGQFQEDRNARGVIFAATEGAFFGASFGVWVYLVSKYGLVSKNVPLADGPGVLRLQQVEIASGIGFFLSYGVGVIDSLWHYKRRERELGSVDSILPVDADPPRTPSQSQSQPQPPAKQKATQVPLLERIRITPMVVPNGAGIGIGWEN